jgi:hypothetical protein
MSGELAVHILNQLRDSFQVSIGECQVTRPGIGDVWRVEAVRNDGAERWAAEHEDYYSAVCRLAELMGLELDDG